MKSPKWVRIALAYATVFLVEKVLNIFKDERADINKNCLEITKHWFQSVGVRKECTIQEKV